MSGPPLTPRQRKFAALAIILAGLALRALLDKLLALRGGAELVAYWAQLQSVADVASAAAIAGVGQGLTVLITQNRAPERQARLLAAALFLGVGLSSLVGLGAGALLFLGGGAGVAGLPPLPVGMALLTGIIAVAPAMLCADWLGRHQQQRVLAYTLAAGLPLALAAWALPPGQLPQHLLAAQALILLVLTLAWMPRTVFSTPARPQAADYADLARFLPVGLANGILTPLSMIVSRAVVSDALTWDEAGLMQALWRTSEWITGLAQGVLSFYFLPRLSAAWAAGDLARTLRRAMLTVALPAAVLLAALYLNQTRVIAWLYRPEFVIPDAAAAYFMLGDALRVASWVLLTGLFAARRIGVLVVGELLSQPLFALLLHLHADDLSLTRAGQLYLLSYAVFLAFNTAALWRVRHRNPSL